MLQDQIKQMEAHLMSSNGTCSFVHLGLVKELQDQIKGMEARHNFSYISAFSLMTPQVKELQDQIKKMEARVAQAQGNGPAVNAAEEAAKRWDKG